MKFKPEDLVDLRRRLEPLARAREGLETGAGEVHLLTCAGTGCVSNNSLNLLAALKEEVARQGLGDRVKVVPTGCNGFCANGPIVVVKPDDTFYQFLKPEDVPELVTEHLREGRPVQRLMYSPAVGQPAIPRMHDIPFFGKQRLIALANRGLVDPESIDEYIALGGYQALAKALTQLAPEDIIREIKDSGLRGRGGAGFPTGRKWELARGSPGEEKYIICNGDEGDPGAFMDRSIVESDPHAVLEGMTIGARAIGASHGFIYIRAEYPLALERLTQAIEDARGYGLLGEDILGTGFDFDVTVSKGAGAFVCGEETSLIGSLEGLLPEPRVRPPYPAQSGYQGKPTNINNVETWANVPHIINRGAKWFAAIGTENCKGTKVFSLVGKIRNTGLVEVPDGHQPSGDRVRHRRRHPRRQEVQGRADRRPLRRLPAGEPAGPAGGLRVPVQGRFDHGLRRHDRHGRGDLHGGGGPLLRVLHPGGVLRQVPAVPGRHLAHDEDPGRHHAGQGAGRGHRAAGKAGRAGQRHGAVRAGQHRPEPRAHHHPPLPPRVRGAHPRPPLPVGGLQGADPLPHPGGQVHGLPWPAPRTAR